MANGKAHGQTGPKGISNERIIEALQKNAGIILAAAQAVGCSRQNLEARIKGDSELAQALVDVEEQEKDIAEGVVRKAMRKGDATTARWYLDRKGGDRGYRNTTLHVGASGGAIEHAVTSQRVDPVTPEEIAAARRRFIDDSDD